MVTVDKGWLDTVLERFGQALGAVARGNNRAAGNKLQDRCVAAIYATGTAPADCPKN